MANHRVLSGWLYTRTRYAAAHVIRREERRRVREQESFLMQEPFAEPTGPDSEIDARRLNAVLDEAMHDLKDPERQASLLRFFERKPFSEMGEALGISGGSASLDVRLEMML